MSEWKLWIDTLPRRLLAFLWVWLVRYESSFLEISYIADDQHLARSHESTAYDNSTFRALYLNNSTICASDYSEISLFVEWEWITRVSASIPFVFSRAYLDSVSSSSIAKRFQNDAVEETEEGGEYLPATRSIAYTQGFGEDPMLEIALLAQRSLVVKEEACCSPAKAPATHRQRLALF